MKIRQHKQTKLNWVLACTILCTTHVNAQKKFTIADCINYAFANNPLLNATVKDTSIAGLGTQRVTGLYLPRVNFVSAFQYYISTRKTLVEGGSPFAPSSLPDGEPKALDVGYNHTWYPSF